MRVGALLLLIGFAVAASPSVGHAEKVKTNQSTNLLSRPGERAKVLVKVKEGQAMTVLAKESRWLKVRVSGRTGWVPRSKVDATEEIARNTRRRSFVDGRGTKRGFNGEEGPDDRVGADALGETEGRGGGDAGGGDEDEADEPAPKKKPVKPKAKGGGDEDDEDPLGGGGGDDDEELKVTDEEDPGDTRPKARVKAKTVALADPDPESDESFKATPDTILFPTGTKKGKYTEVENEEGDLGYVLTSSLDVEEAAGVGGPRSRQIDVRARLGFSYIQQGLRTPGGALGVPNNYNVKTTAATVALGGTVLFPYKARYVVGAELSYDYALSVPGVKEADATRTSIALHHLRARGMFGYDLKKPSGMMLFGRLGLHYQSYQVADVEQVMKNTLTLPSEIIIAPAIGAAFAIPRLTDKIGLRFSVDTILFGASVKQTKNLEDGNNPSAKAALIGAGMIYKWKKAFDLQVTYDLNYYSMSFGDMVMTSQRMHSGGGVTRTDFFHAATIGIAKAF